MSQIETQSTSLSKEDEEKINTFLDNLKERDEIIDFLIPVLETDITLRCKNSYKKKIKKPMDIKTITEKLLKKEYKTAQEAIDDIMLIWDNCKIFNGKKTRFYKYALILEAYSKEIAQRLFHKKSLDNFERDDLCIANNIQDAKKEDIKKSTSKEEELKSNNEITDMKEVKGESNIEKKKDPASKIIDVDLELDECKIIGEEIRNNTCKSKKSNETINDSDEDYAMKTKAKKGRNKKEKALKVIKSPKKNIEDTKNKKNKVAKKGKSTNQCKPKSKSKKKGKDTHKCDEANDNKLMDIFKIGNQNNMVIDQEVTPTDDSQIPNELISDDDRINLAETLDQYSDEMLFQFINYMYCLMPSLVQNIENDNVVIHIDKMPKEIFSKIKQFMQQST